MKILQLISNKVNIFPMIKEYSARNLNFLVSAALSYIVIPGLSSGKPIDDDYILLANEFSRNHGQSLAGFDCICEQHMVFPPGVYPKRELSFPLGIKKSPSGALYRKSLDFTDGIDEIWPERLRILLVRSC